MNNNLPKYKDPPPPPARRTTNETSGEMREGGRPITKTTDDGEPRNAGAGTFWCELLLIAVLVGSVVYAISILIK